MNTEIKTETVRTQEATYYHAGKEFSSHTEGEVSAISDSYLIDAKKFVKSCSNIDFENYGSKTKVIPTFFNHSEILTIDRKSRELVCRQGKTYDEVFERLGIKQQIDDLVAQLTATTYWSDLPIQQPKWSVIDMHRKLSVFMYGDFAVVYSGQIGGYVHDHDIEVIVNLSSRS
jgi:hypothetical protein